MTLSAGTPRSRRTCSATVRCSSYCGWLTSITCSTRSAATASSIVERNEATRLCGSLRMKPTVSITTVSRGISKAARCDFASSVAKSLSTATAPPRVSWLKSVDFPAAGAAGEDVEDQAAAVDDLRADDFLEVADLRRPEVVVEYNELGVVMRGDRLDLLRFPLADERGGIGRGAARQDLSDDVPPRRLDEFLELVEVLLGDTAGEVR